MNNTRPNAKLKVVLACDAFYPTVDGVIRVVDNYYETLTQLGCECLLVIPKHRRNVKIKSNVIRVPSFYKWDNSYSSPLPKLSWHLKHRLNTFKPDIIHIHSPFTIGRWLMKYAKKHHIPIVLSFHTKYRDEFERVLKFKWMQHFVFNYMMKVIDGMSYVYVPIASVNEILKAYGYTKQTLGVIPNGTGMLPVADKTKACQEINASYQLDPYTFVMLFVGRMVSVKNLDLIIDALSIVVKENKNFKMLFVGEGAHKNTMQKNINHLGLAQHCLFLGQINDVKTLAMIYARANLFVFPSIFDTVPMVLFESASQATPLIGIKEAYLASSIQDKVNGYLSENNPQAFAEKILWIIQHPEENKLIGEHAFKTIYFTWTRSCTIAIDEYNKLLANI